MLVAQPKDLDENMLKSNIGGPILGLDENKFLILINYLKDPGEIGFEILD